MEIKRTSTELLKKHGRKTLLLVVTREPANDSHLVHVCIQAELNEWINLMNLRGKDVTNCRGTTTPHT